MPAKSIRSPTVANSKPAKPSLFGCFGRQKVKKQRSSSVNSNESEVANEQPVFLNENDNQQDEKVSDQRVSDNCNNSYSSEKECSPALSRSTNEENGIQFGRKWDTPRLEVDGQPQQDSPKDPLAPALSAISAFLNKDLTESVNDTPLMANIIKYKTLAEAAKADVSAAFQSSLTPSVMRRINTIRALGEKRSDESEEHKRIAQVRSMGRVRRSISSDPILINECRQQKRGQVFSTSGANEFNRMRQAAAERGERLSEIEDATDKMVNTSMAFGQLAKKIVDREKNKRWYQW